MKVFKRLSVQVTVDKSRSLEIKEKNLLFIRANSKTEFLMDVDNIYIFSDNQANKLKRENFITINIMVYLFEYIIY
jgi:hypothetical protein